MVYRYLEAGNAWLCLYRVPQAVPLLRTTSNNENIDHKHYPTNHNVSNYIESVMFSCVKGGILFFCLSTNIFGSS